MYRRLPKATRVVRKQRWTKYRKSNKSWKKTAKSAAGDVGFLAGLPFGNPRMGQRLGKMVVKNIWTKPSRYGYRNVVGSGPQRIVGSAPQRIVGSAPRISRPQVKKFYSRYIPRIYYKKR